MKLLQKLLIPFVFVKTTINKGHYRSVKAKKNIIASFFIRGVSIVIGLVVVPLTINYINPSRYGIWLTLSSIVSWFSFFDIGLSQGLRNKFAEAKAKGDDALAQTYVSTTYAILAIIFFIVWLIFLIFNHFLNWAHVLNISESMRPEVSKLAVIVFTYFCLQFVFRIITTLILANQESAKSSLIDVLGQIVSLVFIVILVKTTEGSLIKLGIALCLSPLLVLIGANLILFNGVFKKYRPGISKVKFSYAKGLFNLGVIFFIIQLAGIIQYQTANIIIAQNFGTTEVTAYQIVFKYFSILNMVYIIFLTPFWSACTEAYLKNDIQWIKNGIKKYTQLNMLLFIAGILMLIFSGKLYHLWLGKAIDSDKSNAAYKWTKISGSASGTITNDTIAATSATALVEGVYRFQLNVTDNKGTTSVDTTVQVAVNAADIPPTAKAGPDQSITLPLNTVLLNRKPKLHIGFYLSLWGLVYFSLTMFATKYVYFLNGINALRIQFLACIVSPVLYVGIAILLIKYYHMGVYSLFIASVIANFNGYILSPLQYYMVIIRNKKGIWIK